MIELKTIEEYRNYYHANLCATQIQCHLGFPILFRRDNFEHAFYESTRGTAVKTNIFSFERAARMDEIAPALRGNIENVAWKAGWDRKKKAYSSPNRVCLTSADLAIVLNISRDASKRIKLGKFVTAYPAGDHTLSKLKAAPVWDGL